MPLTPFEAGSLFLDEGPTVGVAARANAAGYVVAGHRLGFATSLPAFQYGNALGTPAPAGGPCLHILTEYMRCMDSLGVDTVIQAEANDGRSATDAASGAWQPLEWMQSSWRAVADPPVHFAYAVNPMMVGSLADLAFDGQSAIVARSGPTGSGRYVGDSTLAGTDPGSDAPYAGERAHCLALAPWVIPDGSRATLRAESARLAPGSGDRQENDYLQTAVYADLLPVVGVAATPDGAALADEPTLPASQPARLATTGGAGPYAALVLLAALAVVRSSRARSARRASHR